MLKTTSESSAFMTKALMLGAVNPLLIPLAFLHNGKNKTNAPSIPALTDQEWNQFIVLALDNMALQHGLLQYNLPATIAPVGKGWTAQLGERPLFIHQEGNNWDIYMQDIAGNSVSLASHKPPYLPVFGNAQGEVWNYIRTTSLGLYHHNNSVRNYLNERYVLNQTPQKSASIPEPEHAM